MNPMLNNNNFTRILYYQGGTISCDYSLESSKAYRDNFTICYLTNNMLMTVE